MTRDFRVGLSIAALVVGGFALTMAAFYPGYMPNGGFLARDLRPKPSYDRLVQLITRWRS